MARGNINSLHELLLFPKQLFYFVLPLKHLKHILVTMLILGITMPDAIMHQVIHMPALVLHYQHHLTEHEPISFIDFLAMHYGDDNHMQSDAHEHEDLPGNNNHQQCSHLQLIPVISESTNICLQKPETRETKPLAFVSANLSTNSVTAVWQPPKMA